MKQSDSGFDTVKIEKLAVKEKRRERPVSSSGGDLSRDKVYQTFVRPVLSNVSVPDLGANVASFRVKGLLTNATGLIHKKKLAAWPLPSGFRAPRD